MIKSGNNSSRPHTVVQDNTLYTLYDILVIEKSRVQDLPPGGCYQGITVVIKRQMAQIKKKICCTSNTKICEISSFVHIPLKSHSKIT